MTSHRRELDPSDSMLKTQILRGTHAMGGNAGTIPFPTYFSGTPTVTATIMAGSSRMWTVEGFRTPQVNSGSFTYRGSAPFGTFAWTAIGPRR